MSGLKKVLIRVCALVRKDRLETEMDEELRFHLERQIEDNIKTGMSVQEARRAALAGFGGLEQMKEACRDVRYFRLVEQFFQDLRYAFRILRRTPVLTAAVVVSLALGIGANTAVFSVIDALLIRTLPVDRPQELFTLKTRTLSSSDDQYSYQAFTDFREATHGAARLLAASWLERAQILLDGRPELVYQKAVSGSYFSVLDVGASLGRVFTTDEDRLPPPQPVAVISYGFWQRRFGRDPAVLGQSFRYKGDVFTIVGVGPQDFFGETVGEKPDVWIPITAAPRAPDYLWKGHSVTWLQIIGRPETGVARSQVRARLEPVFERMRSERLSGRRSASDRQELLAWRWLWSNRITVEGYTPRPDEAVRTFANSVSARYFEVMGIPLMRGRSFRDADDKSFPRVAIVNQTFARQFFGSAEPIGKRVGLGPAPKEMMEIVGIVRDAKYRDLKEEARSMLYVPCLQHSHPLNELEVRTTAGPAALAAALGRELAAVDPNLPILEVTTLRAQVDASIAGERLLTKVCMVFGLLALALAAVGLYGVLSYSVTRRTNEIGIRMTLGASPGEVLRLVLRETLLLAAIGVAIGVPAALAAQRLIQSQLYGVEPSNPVMIAFATLVLIVVAFAAAYVPARRASRIDPMIALRYE